MANNSIPNGTKVRWHESQGNRSIRVGLNTVLVNTGIVVAQSRQGDEVVIVEWDAPGFGYPVSIEHVDDLIEIE